MEAVRGQTPNQSSSFRRQSNRTGTPNRNAKKEGGLFTANLTNSSNSVMIESLGLPNSNFSLNHKEKIDHELDENQKN